MSDNAATGDELAFQKACMEVVDLFRTGKITEAIAYGRLFALVTKQLPEKDPEEPEFTATLEAYSGLIKEHADKRAAVDSTLKDTSSPTGAGTQPDEPSDPARPTGAVGSTETDTGQGQELAIRDNNKTQTTGSLADVIKHIRDKDAAFSGALPESVRKTLGVLNFFARNWKEADSLIQSSSSRPQLPFSQWKRLVRGQVVDLDVILTSHNSHVVRDDDPKEIADGIDVIIRHGAPSQVKEVRTMGNWILTFFKLRDALLHLFPWRTSELQYWTEFIINEFAAVADDGHVFIIEYDRAVRNRIADSGNKLEFTDHRAFRDLETAFLGQAAQRPKREIVRFRVIPLRPVAEFEFL
jgi:hypothetical protein